MKLLKADEERREVQSIASLYTLSRPQSLAHKSLNHHLLDTSKLAPSQAYPHVSLFLGSNDTACRVGVGFLTYFTANFSQAVSKWFDLMRQWIVPSELAQT